SELIESHDLYNEFIKLNTKEKKNIYLNDQNFKSYLKKISMIVNKNSKILNIVFPIFIINSVSIIFNSNNNTNNNIHLILNNNIFREPLSKLANNNNIKILYLYKLNFIKFWFKSFYINLTNLIKSFFTFKNKYLIKLSNFDLIVDSAVEIINKKYIINQDIIPFKSVLYFSYYNRNDLPKIIVDKISYLELNHFNLSFSPIPNFFLILKSIFSKNFKNLFIKISYNDYYFKVRTLTSLFKKIKPKVYLSSHKFLEHPLFASHAINEIGGVSCIMQSSYSEQVSSSAIINSDIYFSFTNYNYENEIKSGSNFKYLVSVGYFKDYLFSNYKKDGVILRNQLKSNGANFIVSYFDNGFDSNDQYGFNLKNLMEEYEFLLNKLLDNKWLGLIFKSKTPNHIHKFLLNNYGDLYSKSLETKRFIFEINSQTKDSSKNTILDPSQYAFSSDICIHNSLSAATAGLEAILTNTSTLFLDRLGWNSFLKKAKNSKNIIFEDINLLWDQIDNTYKTNNFKSITFDDETLYKLDNFRDGKARDRINLFISNLISNINLYKNKQFAIEKTVSDYRVQWGDDKVIKF
ncbi:hypothetical protein OA492_03365, partial [Pelagibacteraceae bacterium]|nr:hypothetical protein [Pelagibacteraceae bacterium]